MERPTGYGPKPAGRHPHPPLSRSRSALLETLRAQTEPTSLSALVAITGLHANTLREHLAALVIAGLAHRHRDIPTGRGRPAWLYEATGRDAAASPEYAGLAATLAATIQSTSTSPTDDAIAAGRTWGHELAQELGAGPAPSAVAARRAVVTLLDQIGFGPQADARNSTIRLTRCPLLEAAHRYPDVVCGVHLGLAEGALEAYGVAPAGTELAPFAERGACRLHLMRRAG